MADHPVLPRRQLLAAMAGMAIMPRAGAASGELTLVSEPSLKGVLTGAARQFQKETGMQVALKFVRANQMASALKGQDPPDLVVLPQEGMDQLAKAGLLVADSRRPFGRSGLALAVKSGAVAPDVSTPEALKQVLASARSITYSDPADTQVGKQAAHLIERLGLTDALKGRTKLGAGNPLAQVSLGGVDIGLQARHEALETSGVTLAGPLPAALQPWQPYDIALTENASNVAEARQLMQFFAAEAGRKALDAGGLWSQL